MFDASIVPALTPGPALATALADVDLSELDADDLVAVASAAERLASWAHARQLDAVASFADHYAPELEPVWSRKAGRETAHPGGGAGTPQVMEFAAEELGAELGLSSWSAHRLLADALDLRHRLPQIRSQVFEGRVEAWRARMVAAGTRRLSQSQCAAVSEELLPLLPRVTTRRLRLLVDATLPTHA